uniref:Uncharacterized protein n=1 Tax=Rhizophora mucronata TaxID=61149 RepID=A0A2P2PDA6_RHIMU
MYRDCCFYYNYDCELGSSVCWAPQEMVGWNRRKGKGNQGRFMGLIFWLIGPLDTLLFPLFFL